MLKSPFNYTGSKYKLLSQLFPYFPSVETMYDVFCGGGSVTLNSNYKKIVANDVIAPLIRFYWWLQKTPWEDVISEVERRNIPKDNKDKYLELRERFNKHRNCIDFFILCSCCTNNMMRFNKSYDFNQTWGKRNFNPSTEQKLKAYHDKLYKNTNIVFFNSNFYDVKIESGFVYLDPPYCLTEAGYNAYWSIVLESAMYDFIDNLNHRGIQFVLSGVSEHKGKTNPFKNRMAKYDVVPLTMDYKKVAKKRGETQEIIVKNF